MSLSLRALCAVRTVALLGLLALTTGTRTHAQTLPAPGAGRITLPGHIPANLANAQPIGHINAQETLSFALTLPLHNTDELDDLLQRLYDPTDPLYGKFLTPEQFTARFAPTQADYQAVLDFAHAQGLTVVRTYPNRLVVDVQGTSAQTEQAFSLQMLHYQTPDGRTVYAPSADPQIPGTLWGKLSSVVGLDNLAVWKPHFVLKRNLQAVFQPLAIGSGMGGGVTPSNIKNAYNLSTSTLTGSGQTLAVFELDGYTPSDITAYESEFGLPSVPLSNVLVNGANGSPGRDGGAAEVTLDIELAIALAPGVSKVLVYEAPNSGNNVVALYNKIATDNLAKQISTSWGAPEGDVGPSALSSESTAFQQMAAQGQTIFAAAGDSGAYDNGSTLSVDDPASQPYVTGVGGTSLTVVAPNGAWKSETTWNAGSISNGAGGGGISSFWAIPSYQTGVISAASKGSTTKRNVPDVAMNADPNDGYLIYYEGDWYIFGGTSCGGPIWAGFTALVNQQRTTGGLATLGFVNPTLYTLGAGANGKTDFHDIADGSTNLYYPAVTGYDLATGWGSFNGLNLLNALIGGSGSGSGGGSGSGSGGGSGGGGGTTTTQLLGNPGFENGSSKPSPWSATPYVINNDTYEPPHSGSWDAWLDGYGTTHTDAIAQTVTIPSNTTTATLTFYLHIDTAETTKTAANDTLKVQVRNSAGTVLATLATFSNLNHNTGYTLESYNMIAYKGQTIQIYLVGAENSSLQTSFVVDDFALTVVN